LWQWLDAGPAVRAAIAGLERAWTPRALLHGDVKFDNVLASDAGLLLVDWELAGRGEPAWDLAGVVDGLLLGHCAGGGAVDRSLALHVASPALAAYGPGVDADLVAVAAAARLAQTSAQMAAMGGEHEAAAPLVLTAAAGLAEDVLGVCTP
jgi:aminoglycoside phosphotransferase (APT) family kinase protein